jgi:hypothetical protein
MPSSMFVTYNRYVFGVLNIFSSVGGVVDIVIDAFGIFKFPLT